MPRNKKETGKKRKIVFGKRSSPSTEIPRNETLAGRVDKSRGPPGPSHQGAPGPPQGPPGPPQEAPGPGPQGALVERFGAETALGERSGGMEVEMDSNEWEEALDTSQDQGKRDQDEKIAISPRIPNQLLKDFQELCNLDLRSF